MTSHQDVILALDTSQGTVALWVSIITAIGVVIGATLGLMGVRRTTATTSEGTLRGDLLKERELFRDERQDLTERIEALEEKQDDDRRTIRNQAQLIAQQEERILNQNKTIREQGRRITRLENLLHRHKIPIPGSDDTDPGASIPRQ